jgi:hypothetical protein
MPRRFPTRKVTGVDSALIEIFYVVLLGLFFVLVTLSRDKVSVVIFAFRSFVIVYRSNGSIEKMVCTPLRTSWLGCNQARGPVGLLISEANLKPKLLDLQSVRRLSFRCHARRSFIGKMKRARATSVPRMLSLVALVSLVFELSLAREI